MEDPVVGFFLLRPPVFAGLIGMFMSHNVVYKLLIFDQWGLSNCTVHSSRC